MVTLGIPTLNRYADLAALIASAERGTLVPDHYVIVDNGGTLDIGTFDGQEKIHVIRPGRNIGVAASWNIMLRDTPDYIVISNDDAILYPDTIERMITFADQHPNEGFLYGHAPTSQNAWSLFLHRAWCFREIGPYDERFWPAYFEDDDMSYRMRLAGVQPRMILDCIYDHIGSATLRAFTDAEMQQHHARFSANQSYYTEKWGGPPQHEQYRHPFGVESDQ